MGWFTDNLLRPAAQPQNVLFLVLGLGWDTGHLAALPVDLQGSPPPGHHLGGLSMSPSP
jgi:hypothetical protein